MNGAQPGGYAYGMWPVVGFNILLFLFFAIGFIKPKKKAEWRSMGAFVGFIVALFTEMYGFPLTVYLLSTWLGKSYPVLDPFSHPSGHLVLVFLGLAHSNVALAILHLISNGIIFFGVYLLYKGWMSIHGAKGEHLVTESVFRWGPCTGLQKHPFMDDSTGVDQSFLHQAWLFVVGKSINACFHQANPTITKQSTTYSLPQKYRNHSIDFLPETPT